MKRFAFAAAAALSIAVPSVSHATTINITSSGFALGSKDGTLHISGGGPFDNAAASFGQFVLNGTNVSAGGSAVSFFTYCIDLNHPLLIPGTFTIEALSVLFNATQATNITKLLANTNPTTDAESAAVQLAMWEIAFDLSPTKSVTSGPNQGGFYVTGGTSDPAAQGLANTYLASLAGWTVPTGSTAYLLYSAQNQSQVFLVSSVPESATWGMMIVGFGIVGASMRRRIKVSYRLA